MTIPLSGQRSTRHRRRLKGSRKKGTIRGENAQVLPQRHRRQLEQTSPLRLHLDENWEGATETMAILRRQNRQPILPMRSQHHTIRGTHHFLVPTSFPGTVKVNCQPTIMGRARRPTLDQDRPQRIRGWSHQFLRILILPTYIISYPQSSPCLCFISFYVVVLFHFVLFCPLCSILLVPHYRTSLRQDSSTSRS